MRSCWPRVVNTLHLRGRYTTTTTGSRGRLALPECGSGVAQTGMATKPAGQGARKEQVFRKNSALEV